MAIKDFFKIIAASLCLAFEWVMCNDSLPHNVVVMAGSDKVLPCAGGLPFRWYVYPPSNPSEDKVIFMGERMADNSDPRFRVYLKPNNFPYDRLDLLITNIRPDHFGTYKCQKSGSAHCAELIVLGSDPKCNKYETAADEVQLKCKVNVTVNGVPEMSCFHNLNKASIHTHCKRKRGNETTVCKANVPASAKDDYTCVIGVKHQPGLTYKSCVQATSNPKYQFIWNTAMSPISNSSEYGIVKLSTVIAIGLVIIFIIIVISAVSFGDLLCGKTKKTIHPSDSDLKCTVLVDAERQHKDCNLSLAIQFNPLPMSQEHQQLSLVSNMIKIFGSSFRQGYAFLFCKTRSFVQRRQFRLLKMTSIKSASNELLHK